MAEETSSEPKILTASEPAHVHDDNAPLARYFDVESDDYKDKLGLIGEFLRDGKEKYDEFELLMDVKRLINKLGLPDLGESRVEQVYRYAKLASHGRQIEKEMEGMIR